MFKLKFQTIAIAAVIVSLLLIGVNNSKAGNITSLSASANTDYGSDASVSASLSADADISYIDWYVKQTYPADEADTDYTHVHTSMHSHGTRSVSVGLGSYAGHIKIAEYDVKAVVNFSDNSDTSTTGVSIYKPVYESGSKTNGIYGSAELTAHYYDGSSIIMDGYVYAYNDLGQNATGSGRFRHTATNKPLDELEKDLPSKNFLSSYSYSTGDWGTFFNFNAGRIQRDAPWKCNAYLRLQVHKGNTDDWLAESANTFTHEDNR
jgi:hypothetical protein